MSDFIFDGSVEAKGSAALAFLLNGTLANQQKKTILKQNGISELKENDWYSLKSIVGAFSDLGKAVGDMNLFLIGKAVIDQAEFPPMDGLQSALYSIDVAYHMNHRKNKQIMFDPNTGEKLDGIGEYKVTRFDDRAKEAVIVCHTPYPSKFEEGLIVQVVRRFKPLGSIRTKVEIDTSKETRRNGGSTCTFNIYW